MCNEDGLQKWSGDTEFQEHAIEKVDPAQNGGTYLMFNGHTGIYCPPMEPAPSVGNTLRLYGRGMGFPVRGILIGEDVPAGKALGLVTWRTAFYLTTEEHEAKRIADHAESERSQREQFEKEGRAKLDAQYDALPDLFKRRIDKFRANNPDFRWKYESYEMFCCTQAVAFADALKTVDALNAWRALDWKEQREQVPAMDDGHSGNTFGAACALAALYLSRPDDVVRLHGALAPLVGSEEYGCIPKA